MPPLAHQSQREIITLNGIAMSKKAGINTVMLQAMCSKINVNPNYEN
jgi:hypothetical protein